jgi:lysozyme
MSVIDITVARLKTEEGFRSTAYRDTLGKLTIGYGFCIDAGITKYAAETLLTAQAAECNTELLAYSWYTGLDEVRASVLVDMGFNLGLNGLLHFPKMIAAIGDKNWQVAHDELLNSLAAREDPARYKVLAQLLLTGVIA